MAKPKGQDQARIASKIPVSEVWLYRNPEAIAAVRRGLREAAEGNTVTVGSFAAFVD